jgi:hypothetical protein
MNIANAISDQKGGVGAGFIFAVVIIGVLGYFYFYPTEFPELLPSEESKEQLCRPYLQANGDIMPDAPTIMAPSYEQNVTLGQRYPVVHQDQKPYRLIKANVPILRDVVYNYFDVNELRNVATNSAKCNPSSISDAKGYHHHFCQWVHEAVRVNSPLTKAEKYAVMFPGSHAQSTGKESYFYDEDGQLHSLLFADYGILFLLHLTNDNKTYDRPGLWWDYEDSTKIVPKPWALMDVYQRVKDEDQSIPVNRVPEAVLKCGKPWASFEGDKPLLSYTDNLGPNRNPDNSQEHLDWFLFNRFDGETNWYFPACKPAVYLYPQKEQRINVQVGIKQGFLTYTDPVYPKGGWDVVANPSGKIQYLGAQIWDSQGKVQYPSGVFPYLYYEGKITSTQVKRPETGYVVSLVYLSKTFDTLLPRLGLTTTEAAAFKQYWLRVLPPSPYYFIGVMPQEEVEENEPLTITPKEDTMIRVRLYFEALDTFKDVEEPKIKTPARKGFTVVDWGGLVKTDKDHPFTCVQ